MMMYAAKNTNILQYFSVCAQRDKELKFFKWPNIST